MFWTLPTAILRGTAAAGGLALLNSFANLGGFFGPDLMGWLKQADRHLHAGHVALGGDAGASPASSALWIGRMFFRRNLTCMQASLICLAATMTRAFLFPGQGSQAVGMGKVLADAFAPAREVFQEVDDALSQKLSRLMWEGPESRSDPDRKCPARDHGRRPSPSSAVLEKEGGLDVARHARLVAGHSLGEYSALCAAGAFTLADTARLLKIRGQAMQSAVPVGEGAHDRPDRRRDRDRRSGGAGSSALAAASASSPMTMRRARW